MDTPQVSQTEVKKKSSKSGYVIGILIFLVICLSGGLTYYILKDKGTNLLLGLVENYLNSDTTTTDTDTTNDTSSLENATQTTVSLEKYGLEVEIPNYNITEQVTATSSTETMTATVTSAWKIVQEDDATNNLDNYLTTLSLDASAVESFPEWYACDSVCAGSLHIWISVYANPDKMTLAEAKDAYTESWNTKYGDEDEFELTSTNVTKWNEPVIKFEQILPRYTYDIYVVVRDNYIYEISTDQIDISLSDPVQQMILDSIKIAE